MSGYVRTQNAHQAEFVRLFNTLCYNRNRWPVWADFVQITALTLNTMSTPCKTDPIIRKRVEDYRTLVARYSEDEIRTMDKMFEEIVNGFEENPDQDFLGSLYMVCELGNDCAGQFFTPYDICKMTAQLTYPETDVFKEREWFGCNDPACGAGALLIAFANTLKARGINYQNACLFTAQDVDYVVGMMCYIQLTLMGCAGYVCIGNTLSEPLTCKDEHGLIPATQERIWFTPMYWFNPAWQARIFRAQMNLLGMNLPETKYERAKECMEEPTKVLEPAPAAEEESSEYSETESGQLSLF